ncbi:MAG: BatD family protein [Myxococcota bacterium]
MILKHISLITAIISSLFFRLSVAQAAPKANYEIKQEAVPQTARLDEQITLKVIISATVSSRGGSFSTNFYDSYTPPNLSANFKIVDSSQSTRRHLGINNNNYFQSFSHIFTYMLQPKKQGNFVIPSASMKVKNRTYRSNQLKITINPPRKSPQAVLQGNKPDLSQEGDQFVQAVVSKKEVYLGEPVIVSWYAYTFSRHTDFASSDLPEAPGFFSKSLYKKRRSYQMEKIRVGNTLYLRTLLYQRVYWPQKSGELTIGKRVVNLQTRNFLLSSSKPLIRASAPIKIMVKKLPRKNRPTSFNEDNVGKFDLKLDLADSSIKANEAIDLEIVISGEGLLTAISPPDLPQLSWARIEKNGNPSYKEKIERDNQIKITGKVTFKYILIPKESGNFTFPGLKFHYFDPETESYQTIKTKVRNLTVAPSPAGNKSNSQKQTGITADEGKENTLAPKLKPVRVKTVNSSSLKARFFSPTVFRFVLFGPPFIWMLFSIFLVARKKYNEDKTAIARRKFRSTQKKDLKRLKTYLKQNRKSDFYSVLSKVIIDAVSQATGCSAHGLTNQELKARLLENDASDKLVKQIMESLDTFDFARYTPDNLEHNLEMENSLKETRKLLSKINKL